MFIKLTNTDRVAVAINSEQVTFISQVSDGTRIRFGEGRSVTVVEPLDEIVHRMNPTTLTSQPVTKAAKPKVARREPEGA